MSLPQESKKSFPYKIQKMIGQGSMGTVFLAQETSLERPVAIKTLRPDFLDGLGEKAARDASRRFLQEARAIAKLSHPGIVSVYRLGTENGTAYIAMEWLEGHTLEALIDAEAPLTVERATAMGVELLDIIGAAHDGGVVHRDIKPGNIIVGPGGKLKLTDFGVAHVKDSTLVQTAAGSIIGTPLYAAPEQLNDGKVDARADLYSVGVLLYEMLSGELPFDAENIVTLIGEILSKTPPPLRSLNPAVSESLAGVVSQALAKDKARRFASAGAMKAALERSVFAASELTASELAASENAASELQADGAGLDEMTATYDTPPEEASQVPTYVVEAAQPAELVAKTVSQWTPSALGSRDTAALLDRLLEAPLHTDPFAGAARLGDALFLISQGLVYGAVDVEAGRVGDEVHESLPQQAPATLYAVPEHLDPRVVMHLASLLYPPKRQLEGLDSTLTDLPRLAKRLQSQGFDGAVRLQMGDELAFLMMHKGAPVLDVFSSGWPANPVDTPWQAWISNQKVVAHVEERRTLLPALTYRRELANLHFAVLDQSGDESNEPTKLEICDPDDAQRKGRASTVWRDIYHSDRMYGLANWLLGEVPGYLEERRRFDGWKYLSEWIDEIAHGRLYHELEPPARPRHRRRARSAHRRRHRPEERPPQDRRHRRGVPGRRALRRHILAGL
jgi:serine/threonine protein kinase